jgi:hypothetical protein
MNTIKNEKQRLLDCLYDESPGSDDYKAILQNLDLLNNVETRTFGISNDTVISSVAHLAGVLLILNFEKLGILTSRASSFIPRIRS